VSHVLDYMDYTWIARKERRGTEKNLKRKNLKIIIGKKKHYFKNIKNLKYKSIFALVTKRKYFESSPFVHTKTN